MLYNLLVQLLSNNQESDQCQLIMKAFINVGHYLVMATFIDLIG